MSEFVLNSDFNSKIFIKDIGICRVLLEDNKNFPWLILVPRINGLKNILDMPVDLRPLFWKEVESVSHLINAHFKPFQVNIAMLGNVTLQLHCHIIARFTDDIAWPKPVWGFPTEKYSEHEKESIVGELTKSLL